MAKLCWIYILLTNNFLPTFFLQKFLFTKIFFTKTFWQNFFEQNLFDKIFIDQNNFNGFGHNSNWPSLYFWLCYSNFNFHFVENWTLKNGGNSTFFKIFSISVFRCSILHFTKVYDGPHRLWAWTPVFKNRRQKIKSAYSIRNQWKPNCMNIKIRWLAFFPTELRFEVNSWNY